MLRSALAFRGCYAQLQRAALRPQLAAFASISTPPPSPTGVPEGEPPVPVMKTQVPGPESQRLMTQHDLYQDTRAVMFVQNFEQSIGNYVVDADGNKMLDAFNQISSLAMGYNNPALLKAAQSPQVASALVNRPSLGTTPPTYWADLLSRSLMAAAPPGLQQVFTAMCGSCANECAYKAVFMAHQRKKRGGAPNTEEELSSCMNNAKPGSPELSIMSFRTGFHGRMFGSLSTTRSKAIHKVDIPAFNWPAAPFPSLKYPLAQHAEENAAEEKRCLDEVRRMLEEDPDCVGVIVEPIQAEGGDNDASNDFFRGLRHITKELDRYLIVDEVQTGGGPCGTFWAHEQWDLPTPPDVVTFSKKIQAAGFYHNMDLRPAESYRNFNTWMGDPLRNIYFEALLKEMERQNVLENVRITGDYLKSNLENLGSEYPSLIANVRGRGTFISFDCETPAARDQLVATLRGNGVHGGGCGVRSVRLRPQLVFTPSHAHTYLSILGNTLAEL